MLKLWRGFEVSYRGNMLSRDDNALLWDNLYIVNGGEDAAGTSLVDVSRGQVRGPRGRGCRVTRGSFSKFSSRFAIMFVRLGFGFVSVHYLRSLVHRILLVVLVQPIF